MMAKPHTYLANSQRSNETRKCKEIKIESAIANLKSFFFHFIEIFENII